MTNINNECMLLLNEHELKKQWVKSQDDRHRNKRRALQILLSGRLNLHSEFSLLVRLKFRNRNTEYRRNGNDCALSVEQRANRVRLFDVLGRWLLCIAHGLPARYERVYIRLRPARLRHPDWIVALLNYRE